MLKPGLEEIAIEAKRNNNVDVFCTPHSDGYNIIQVSVGK
jgi:hypothetical protein